MDGPERLEVGRPSRGGPTPWLLAVVVAVALVVLLAVRVDGRGGRTSPPPSPGPTGGPVAADRAWAGGAGPGPGTLYVVAGRTVLAVDGATGAVTRTGVGTEIDVRLTAARTGVLVWYPDGRPARLLNRATDVGHPLTGALVGADAFLPGPKPLVWAAHVDRALSRPTTAWRLVDEDGSVIERVEVRGRAVADGAGGVLAVADGTVAPAFPRTRRRTPEPGAVVATGRDGFVVQRCGRDACRSVLHTGPGAVGRPLAVPLASSAVDGALSPDNRFVLVTQLVGDAPVVQVRPLRSARPRRTFPGGGTGAVWLSERQVAFLGPQGLVLYDAVDDTVVPTALGDVTRLAWQSA